MEPKIVEKEAFTLVGMGAPFISVLSKNASNVEVIPALWGRFSARLPELKARTNRDTFGAVWCLEDGGKVECYYLACAEVARADEVPAGMEARQVPAGKFAIFTHKGTLDKLAHTMSFIHGSWLPKSGYRYRDSAPELELYDDRFAPQSADSELDIWTPIT